MFRSIILAGCLFGATPALAQLAPPPIPEPALRQALPYLMTASMSDIFEVTSSQVALQRSQNAEVRSFASMLIQHHTETTNGALAAAKAAGITPPAAIMNERFRAMIAELQSAPAADFDRVYLAQQVPAHEGALRLNTEYAAGGDTPQLQQAAGTAVPLVQHHLERARALQGGSR